MRIWWKFLLAVFVLGCTDANDAGDTSNIATNFDTGSMGTDSAHRDTGTNIAGDTVSDANDQTDTTADTFSDTDSNPIATLDSDSHSLPDSDSSNHPDSGEDTGVASDTESIGVAQFSVYDYPDTLCNSNHGNNSRSTAYQVWVSQNGVRKEAYVMYDKNQKPEGNLALNPDNHWTNFSFAKTVSVEIKRLDGKNITSCNVYPTAKGYTAATEGNKAFIQIAEADAPLHLYVEMNGKLNEPLFLFADPLETDVPDRHDTDVTVIKTTDSISAVHSKLTNEDTYVVFEEGIHRWGTATGTGYAGYKLPIVSNKKIYIPGGAYVVGTFSGDNKSNFKIYGRGVISACGLDELNGTDGIPYSMVAANGGGRNQQLEGFVSMDPPHFHLTMRGQTSIDNVKMFSWWHSTDGTVTGDNSTVQNCFFKVMDDAIKVYADNCYYVNNTMYHQVNGAPFQFSWGAQNGDNNVINDTYIVESVYKSLSGTSNTAVIDGVGGATSVTENNSWDGLYIDNGCHRLLGINGDNKSGAYRNFTFKNVAINTRDGKLPQKLWSYLQDGTFTDFNFINLRVNGHLITGTQNESDAPARGKLWFQGQTDALSFSQ